MRKEEFLQKINKTKDGNSIKLCSIEKKDISIDNGSKILETIRTGYFPHIKYKHEIRYGENYGVFYQKQVISIDDDGNDIIIGKIKSTSFTLKCEDGDINIRQGKIS